MIAPPRLFTESEYLEQERKAAFKSEYDQREIIPMSGTSRNHSRVKENLIGLVGQALIDSNCQSFSLDMRVNLPDAPLYAYPDIVIACGELHR